jgi:hypothetical protein
MKARLPRIPSIAASLALSIAVATAIPSTLRIAEGHVIAVEPAAHRFTFQRGDNHKRFVLIWDKRTIFADGVSGTPASLKVGQPVRLGYGLPLFGPDYVRRVALLPAHGRRIRPHVTSSSKCNSHRHPCK